MVSGGVSQRLQGNSQIFLGDAISRPEEPRHPPYASDDPNRDHVTLREVSSGLSLLHDHCATSSMATTSRHLSLWTFPTLSVPRRTYPTLLGARWLGRARSVHSLADARSCARGRRPPRSDRTPPEPLPRGRVLRSRAPDPLPTCRVPGREREDAVDGSFLSTGYPCKPARPIERSSLTLQCAETMRPSTVSDNDEA